MVIVSARYNAAVPVEMTVERETKKLTDGNFVIKDANGEVLFKPESFLFEDEMVLLDDSGSPLLNIKIVKNILMPSVHGNWQVFKGESVKENDLLYTVKSSLNFRADVFLGHNKEEKICDFRVKGPWLRRSCVVYAGESDVIVAEMQKKPEVQKGVDNFSVTVYPNNDSAFIASLTIILDHMIRQDRRHIAGHGAVHVAEAALHVAEAALHVAEVAGHVGECRIS